MSQPAGVVGRTTPAEAGAAAGGVHLTALYRAYGRIFSIVAVLPVLVFWVSAATQPGLRPASATANALLSLLLVRLAMSTLRRPLTQQDLNVLAVATGVLVLASRLLATPGSPFLEQAAYLPVNPIVIAWAALSRRLVALVPVLLTVLATGVWNPGSLVLQQLVTTLTTGAFAGFAARMLRSGAARADAEADRLGRGPGSRASRATRGQCGAR